MNTPNAPNLSRPEQPSLFEASSDDCGSVPQAEPPELCGQPRLRTANREQVVFRAAALDDLLPPDHPARTVWDYVEGLDLSPLYRPIKAVDGRPGRPPIDPKILMALWLYATIDGVGSARQLDELCRRHAAYQWICGDVSVNYHTLADFRTAHGELLDQLLTQSVAVLTAEGLVDLNPKIGTLGAKIRRSGDRGVSASTIRDRRNRADHQAVVQPLLRVAGGRGPTQTRLLRNRVHSWQLGLARAETANRLALLRAIRPVA